MKILILILLYFQSSYVAASQTTEYETVSIVCQNNACIQKIITAYEYIGCSLTKKSFEKVDFNGVTGDAINFYKYQLSGCLKPTQGDDAAGLAPAVEINNYKCFKGYSLKKFKVLGRSEFACIKNNESSNIVAPKTQSAVK